HAFHPVLAAQFAVVAGHLEGAPEGVIIEAPGAVDTLAEPHNLEGAHDVVKPAVLDVGDEQAEGIGAAVKRGDAGHASTLVRPGDMASMTPHRPTRSALTSQSRRESSASSACGFVRAIFCFV